MLRTSTLRSLAVTHRDADHTETQQISDAGAGTASVTKPSVMVTGGVVSVKVHEIVTAANPQPPGGPVSCVNTVSGGRRPNVGLVKVVVTEEKGMEVAVKANPPVVVKSVWNSAAPPW